MKQTTAGLQPQALHCEVAAPTSGFDIRSSVELKDTWRLSFIGPGAVAYYFGMRTCLAGQLAGTPEPSWQNAAYVALSGSLDANMIRFARSTARV